MMHCHEIVKISRKIYSIYIVSSKSSRPMRMGMPCATIIHHQHINFLMRPPPLLSLPPDTEELLQTVMAPIAYIAWSRTQHRNPIEQLLKQNPLESFAISTVAARVWVT